MLRKAVAFLLIVPLWASAVAPPIRLPKGVAALVNGEPIMEFAVQRSLERVAKRQSDTARLQIIEYLANNLVIDQKLRAIPTCTVEKAEVDAKLRGLKAELKKTRGDFTRMLADLKVTEAELRQHIAADIRWFKYADAKATDKALQDLFARERDMFDGTKVRARHILITARDDSPAAWVEVARKVREVKKAIEKDAAERWTLVETFAKYARAESECPTKAEGGELALFPRAGQLVAPFADAAFALKVNQMSDAVRTPFGMHLILVTDRKPGPPVKFERVKDAVRDAYFERLHDELAATLRKKATILVNPAK